MGKLGGSLSAPLWRRKKGVEDLQRTGMRLIERKLAALGSFVVHPS